MQQLLKFLSANTQGDFYIKSYDGWRLTLYGGTSFEYARPIASFLGVSYISCPFEFHHASFRLAKDAERRRVGECIPLAPDDLVVAIEAETMASLDRQLFFIAASGLELRK